LRRAKPSTFFMCSSALRPWWRHPGPLLALALHGVIFLGLFQLRLPNSAWKEMQRSLPAEPTTRDWYATIMSHHGPWGLVIWFFDTHEEIQLYRRYGEIAVRGIDVKRPNDLPGQGRFRLYQDVPVEYQPGALLMFVPPALVARTLHGYETAFTAWCGLIYLATLLVGFRVVGGRTTLSAAAANRALWSSAAFLLCFGGVAAARFDHVVPLICIVAIAVFQRAVRLESMACFAIAGAIIAIGVLTKIVPGVLLPAMLLWLAIAAPAGRWRSAGVLTAGFLLTLLALHSAFYAWWGDGYVRSYTYHLERGIQIESSYSGLILAAHGFGEPYQAIRQFGACDLVTPLAPVFKLLSPLLFLAFATLVTVRLWSSRRTLPRGAPGIPVLMCTVLFLFAFILTNKVLSPQYLLWLGPLCAIVYATRPRLRLAVIALGFSAAISQALFPHLYDLLLDLKPLPIALLNLRNATLFIVFVSWCWKLPELFSEDDIGIGSKR
jgi:hypothetical protein